MAFKNFICGLLSMVIAVVVVVALIGAVSSGDKVFVTSGVISLVVWAVIVVRSIKYHNINDPSDHSNHL